VVEVTFHELNLQESANCSSDSVELYDHYTPDQSLGLFCTDAPSSTIRSTSPWLVVVFRTDHTNNTGRFELSWTFVSSNDEGWFVRTVY